MCYYFVSFYPHPSNVRFFSTITYQFISVVSQINDKMRTLFIGISSVCCLFFYSTKQTIIETDKSQTTLKLIVLICSVFIIYSCFYLLIHFLQYLFFDRLICVHATMYSVLGCRLRTIETLNIYMYIIMTRLGTE